MANNHYSYYSRGFVVEYLDTGEDRCSSWLLLPAENLWPQWFRGLLYCIALFYFFVGIAIASDIFMCSIEVITARKRTISKWDPEKNEMVQREVGDPCCNLESCPISLINKYYRFQPQLKRYWCLQNRFLYFFMLS